MTKFNTIILPFREECVPDTKTADEKRRNPDEAMTLAANMKQQSLLLDLTLVLE